MNFRFLTHSTNSALASPVSLTARARVTAASARALDGMVRAMGQQRMDQVIERAGMVRRERKCASRNSRPRAFDPAELSEARCRGR